MPSRIRVRVIEMEPARKDSIAEVERRLRILEDERAILDTLYRYAHCIDYGLEQEFLDCLTDDAELRHAPPRQSILIEQSRVGMHPVERTGREQLAKFIATHTHPPQQFHKHFLVEPRISIHGDEAEVDSYFVRFDAYPQDNEAFVRSFGRYRDKL